MALGSAHVFGVRRSGRDSLAFTWQAIKSSASRGVEATASAVRVPSVSLMPIFEKDLFVVKPALPSLSRRPLDFTFVLSTQTS
jgi:hypothetical protein